MEGWGSACIALLVLRAAIVARIDGDRLVAGQVYTAMGAGHHILRGGWRRGAGSVCGGRAAPLLTPQGIGQRQHTQQYQDRKSVV